jgi:hypothetical protein
LLYGVEDRVVGGIAFGVSGEEELSSAFALSCFFSALVLAFYKKRRRKHMYYI